MSSLGISISTKTPFFFLTNNILRDPYLFSHFPILLDPFSSEMIEHTQKLLDDPTNEKIYDALTDLEYEYIDINTNDKYGKTLLQYASSTTDMQLFPEYLRIRMYT